MESNAIKICGDDKEVLSVELKNVLECVVNGNQCEWSILWLEAIGNIGKSIPEFEKEISNSEKGVLVTWESLLELSGKFDQVIELLLIGDKSISKLKRYSGNEEMYSNCEYVIELIDSSYWLVHSKNEEVLTQMKNNLLGVESIY
jgi:hypothetical protein